MRGMTRWWLDILCYLVPCMQAPSVPPVRATGTATVYWLGDGHNNGKLGCVGASRRLLGHNVLSDMLPVIATRWRPRCGTLVLIENVKSRKTTWALVLDRGPFGCKLQNGERIVSLRCPGKRLSLVDLTPRIAKELGIRGRGTVRLRWW